MKAHPDIIDDVKYVVSRKAKQHTIFWKMGLSRDSEEVGVKPVKLRRDI